MFPTLVANKIDRFLLRPGRPVGTVRSQRVKHVNDRKKTGMQGDLVLAKPNRVAAAVPFLMMIMRDVDGLAQVRDGRQQFKGIARMLANDLPFIDVERAGF